MLSLGAPTETKRRVLIVDDDDDTCTLLASRLTALGFCVESKTSAREALALFAKEDFDAVVTDVKMPEMGGLELCERLVAARSDVPIILVTGSPSMEVAVAAFHVGARDFVPKPVEVDQLARVLDRAVLRTELQQEVHRLPRAASDAGRIASLLGAPRVVGA